MATMTGEDEDLSLLYEDGNLMDFISSYYGIEFPERDVAKALYTYGCPSLLALGTVGNLLSTVILFKMCHSVLSTCLYLFVVSLVDLLVLYVRAGNRWLMNVAKVDVRHVAMFSSNSICKIFPFVSDFALHLSIWLLVSMATETTLVTMRRERLLRACVVERARAVVLLIIVLLVCINAHCFWTYALESDEKHGLPEEIVCTNARQGHVNETFRRIVWPIVDMLVADLFPFLTIFACTVIIITRRVRRSTSGTASVTGNGSATAMTGSNYTSAMRAEENVWKAYKLDGVAARDFQTTMLVLCIFYLILMLPKFACDIFLFLVDPNQLGLVQWSLSLDSKTELGQAVCSLLHYACLSLKFFVYLSSPRFRQELRLLLTCRPCRRKRRSSLTKRPLPKRANNRCPLVDKSSPTRNHENALEKKPFAITSV